MNILHVVNISFVIPYFLGKQLMYFQQKGNKEFVICSFSNELDNLAKRYNFEYLTVDIIRKTAIIKDLKAVYSTAMYIKKKKVNIVTGHTPKGALIAMLAANIMRVPIRIYFRHGLVYETSSGIKRKLLMTIDRLTSRLATKIVCVSPSVCFRSIEDKLNSASKQCLLSQGTCNGIDVNRFCRSNIDGECIIELRRKYGIKKEDYVLGFTGRLVRDKGIIELINAFQHLQVKHSNWKLLLVGMLEERDALPKNIEECIKQNPNIIYTGYVQNSSIEYYYALMDVFVLLSYREGFPTSVLEASAMELPVITTKVTGCIDSIIEKETGVFVKHSLENIAAAMCFFYLNVDNRKKYGENGRKFVLDNFDQYIIWNEIEKLYICQGG